MRRLVYAFSVLVLLLLPHSTYCIEPDETGLITGGELTIPIVVFSLRKAEANVGLTEAKILHEVELRLLRHGIIPADREAAHALSWSFGIDQAIEHASKTESPGRYGTPGTAMVTRESSSTS